MPKKYWICFDVIFSLGFFVFILVLGWQIVSVFWFCRTSGMVGFDSLSLSFFVSSAALSLISFSLLSSSSINFFFSDFRNFSFFWCFLTCAIVSNSRESGEQKREQFPLKSVFRLSSFRQTYCHLRPGIVDLGRLNVLLHILL